jgi:hypothetical protein
MPEHFVFDLSRSHLILYTTALVTCMTPHLASHAAIRAMQPLSLADVDESDTERSSLASDLEAF